MNHHCLLASALLLASAASAQVTITRVIPEAANAGDLVIIRGTNLQDTATVDFFADTGGFVGGWTVSETPLTVSPTQVTVLVTSSFGFAPPNATPPGNPFGSLSISDVNGRSSNSVKFFYMKGTFVPPAFAAQQTTTLGTGTTKSNGTGKSVVSFLLSGGPPSLGNAGFVMELENGVPSGTATLLVGLPGTGPFFMFGDGTFVLDLTAPIISVPGVPVNASGDGGLPFPIPAGPFGVTLCNQWGQLDLGLPGGIAVSNGLVYTI